jgi:hypothetical protein
MQNWAIRYINSEMYIMNKSIVCISIRTYLVSVEQWRNQGLVIAQYQKILIAVHVRRLIKYLKGEILQRKGGNRNFAVQTLAVGF